MSDLAALVFRFTGRPPMAFPIDLIMQTFEVLKDQCSAKVENRQYLIGPDRFAELSEIEVRAICGVVGTVRKQFPAISATTIIDATELVRQWVHECYEAWGKGREAPAFFDQVKALDKALDEANTPKSEDID